MDVFKTFAGDLEAVVSGLAADGVIPADLTTARVSVEPPRDQSHGDIATNVAMVLAKPAGMKPRDLADQIAVRLRPLESIDQVDVAGPGFINVTLSSENWTQVLMTIVSAAARMPWRQAAIPPQSQEPVNGSPARPP